MFKNLPFLLVFVLSFFVQLAVPEIEDEGYSPDLTSDETNMQIAEDELNTEIEGPDELQQSHQNRMEESSAETDNDTQQEISSEEASSDLMPFKNNEYIEDETNSYSQNEELESDITQNENDGTDEQTDSGPDVTVQQGLAEVGILSDTSLTAVHNESGDGHVISLTYQGFSVLNLSLLSNTYIIFHLPDEIAAVLNPEDISMSYDIPGLLIRQTGTFGQDAITFEGSQISANFRQFLSVSLLSTFYFYLDIRLDELPPTLSGEYLFQAEATSQIVDLSILEGNVAAAVLTGPQIAVPDSPEIQQPIYAMDTIVNGTGEPNSQVIVIIGEEEYIGTVDQTGQFSVNIPPQIAGTLISVVIDNGHPQRSEADSAIVIDVPSPPFLEDVYHRDRSVTGTSDPDALVQLTINGQVYSGTTDENGFFSIVIPEQDVGTIISAVTVDEYGTPSELTELTVLEASLSFHSVPAVLQFEPTVIQSKRVNVLRQESDWTIEILDTRGQGSGWRLMAYAELPLTSVTSAHTLPDALVYIDESGIHHPITDEAIEVYAGTTEHERIIPVNWQADRGLLLNLVPADAFAEEYRTAITWVLSDVP